MSRSVRLSGFSEDVDWRPLVLFGEPPAELVCVFCGVISVPTLPLSSGKHACRVCRAQISRTVCSQQDVPVDEVEKVMKMKSSCINAVSGCEFNGTLTEQEFHYSDSCGYHTTSCPRCSKVVLHKNLWKHFSSQCEDYVQLSASASKEGGRECAVGSVASNGVASEVCEASLHPQQALISSYMKRCFAGVDANNKKLNAALVQLAKISM
ncbi:hypothetical protein HPB48_007548 [Haemaphysalis longicornis]|uniref:Uncharacterized protein n=1 Tax=Haemaphysalis longicornis TaxID=44386 RepID=A0A9J6FCW7_HAELO|nr:hypothetical protein HPB48_007548 [Haemaphysalis longicornis]